jgi:DNA-binding NarL/FixJ family response regulator
MSYTRRKGGVSRGCGRESVVALTWSTVAEFDIQGTRMQLRQVILANEPRLLRSLFHRALGKIPALEVAGEVNNLAGLPAVLDSTEVHWVIVALSVEGGIPHVVESLLVQYPATGVVGIAMDGSLVEIQYAGQPKSTASGWSLDELVAALCRQQPLLAGGGV